MSDAAPPALVLRNITKRFPGVQALDQVSLSVEPGEIHCLVGENGAGKSTLIKILSGVYPAGTFEGEIVVDGVPRAFAGAGDAARAGIATIYQELSLLPRLSVAENIYLGRQATRRRLPFIAWDRVNADAAALLRSLDIAIPPTTAVAELTVSERQQVEIAKAISRSSRILILDEPTSSLPDAEVARLHATLRSLRRQGTAIIYISHRLDEVFALADTVTVLRDGSVVATHPAAQLSRQELVAMMVGRTLTDMRPRHAATPGGVALAVRNLTVAAPGPARPLVAGVSFEVRTGEIVTLTGLIGAGCTEVMRALWGAADRPVRGEIAVAGQPVTIGNPRQAAALGLAYVPGDRKEGGLVLSMSCGDNLTLAVLQRLSRGLVVNQRVEEALVSDLFGRLRVRAASPRVPVGTLSGGNQQKISMGKWLATTPRVLLLDEPTRGIDVGSKVEIYHLMNQLVEQGMAIVMTATDLPEALGISDRILVMSRGRLTGELARAEATQEKVMALATETVLPAAGGG